PAPRRRRGQAEPRTAPGRIPPLLPGQLKEEKDLPFRIAHPGQEGESPAQVPMRHRRDDRLERYLPTEFAVIEFAVNVRRNAQRALRVGLGYPRRERGERLVPVPDDSIVRQGTGQPQRPVHFLDAGPAACLLSRRAPVSQTGTNLLRSGGRVRESK